MIQSEQMSFQFEQMSFQFEQMSFQSAVDLLVFHEAFLLKIFFTLLKVGILKSLRTHT